MPAPAGVIIQRYAGASAMAVGSPVALTPPQECAGVVVGNATPGDIQILSQTTDLTQYEVISAGYAWTFIHPGTARVFQPSTPAFYLVLTQAGPVTVQWLA